MLKKVWVIDQAILKNQAVAPVLDLLTREGLELSQEAQEAQAILSLFPIRHEDDVNASSLPILLLSSTQDMSKAELWCRDHTIRGSLLPFEHPELCRIAIRWLASNVSKEDLAEIGQSIHDVNLKVERELSKLKKLHRDVVPRRHQDIRGLRITSKYGVGDSSGGDYFDCAHDTSAIVLFMSSVSSYLANTVILSTFTSFKSRNDYSMNALTQLVSEIEQQMRYLNLARTKKIETELFVVRIDLRNLQINGFQFGRFTSVGRSSFSLIRNPLRLDTSTLPLAPLQGQLSRGDRLLVFSPGISKNWGPRGEDALLTWLKQMNDKVEEPAIDVLNDVLIALPRDPENDFLKYDAFAVMIEVNAHVIVEV